MKSTISLSIFFYIPLVASCTVQSNVQFTFYGYPDNSPPGAGIAYDCGRGYSAGGRKPFHDIEQRLTYQAMGHTIIH